MVLLLRRWLLRRDDGGFASSSINSAGSRLWGTTASSRHRGQRTTRL
jgi:hypothetical protein